MGNFVDQASKKLTTDSGSPQADTQTKYNGGLRRKVMRVFPAFIHRILSPSSMNTDIMACVIAILEDMSPSSLRGGLREKSIRFELCFNLKPAQTTSCIRVSQSP